MEPRIIPKQLPPGYEIAIPPGHCLPPQQPLGTYKSRPLPPLPFLRPEFPCPETSFLDVSRTTRSTSRSQSRTRAATSPSPSGRKTIDRLEDEISTILIQHSPTPVSRTSLERRSCSPRLRRPIRDEDVARNMAPRRLSTPMLSTPITDKTPIITERSPRTLHRSSAKIKQITGLDVDYKAFTPPPPPPPPRPSRSPAPGDSKYTLATSDNSSSVCSVDGPPSASEPARTLSMIDDYDEDSEFESEFDFSPNKSRRNYASWIPASPVPPRVEILDFDEASPRRRDSEIGPLRSPGMHHFETLPARRNNHMEVSYVGAKDLYHATATSIAVSTRIKTLPSARTSGESGSEPSTIMQSKDRLSFAAKVLQSGRKRPPQGINTGPGSSMSLAPPPVAGSGKHLGRTLQAGVHSHSLDDDRLRVKYSEAISRVFRWSGEHRRTVSKGASPVEPAGAGAEAGAAAESRSVPTTTPVSAGPSLPVTPASASPTNRASRRSVQGLAAQVRRTASTMVQSKDERRRELLRQSIRVIPEGCPL